MPTLTKMNLDEEDIEWCTLVREKVDSIMVSQINYEKECGDNIICPNLPRIGYKMPYNKVYTRRNNARRIC